MKTKNNIKLTTRTIVTSIFLFSFLSAQLFAQQNMLVPSEQIVASPLYFNPENINNPLSKEIIALQQNLSESTFYKLLHQGLLQGNLPTTEITDMNGSYLTAASFYDPSFKLIPLSHDQLMKKGERSSIVMMEIEPGLVRDTLISVPGKWQQELIGTIFYESWSLDGPDKLFKKNIKAIIPLHTSSDFGGSLTYRLCAIPFNYSERELNKMRRRAKFSNRVSYVYNFRFEDSPYFKQDQWESPYMTNLTIKTLVEYMFEMAQSRTITPREISSNKPLSAEEVERRLTKQESIMIEVAPGLIKDTVLFSPVQYEEIKSVLFIEDWYISENPFMVFKDVVGIAPIQYASEINEGDQTQFIPFVLYFDESKIN